MIISLLFMWLLLYRLKKSNDRKLLNIVLFGLFVNIIFLFLFQISTITNLVPGTLNTDDLTYIQKAINLLETPGPIYYYYKDFSGGYVIFVYLIFLTGFIKSAWIVSFVNVLMFLNIVVLIYRILIDSNFREKGIYASLVLLVLNGYIIYTNIRVLKDVLLLYLIFEIFNLVKKKFFFKWVVIFLLALGINTLRPFLGYLIILISLLQETTFVKVKNLKKVERDSVIILIIISLLAFYFFRDEIEGLVNMANLTALRDAEKFGSSAVIENINKPLYFKIIIGVLRFVLLPIPIALIFEKSNLLYKVLMVMGSSVWWFILWKACIKLARFNIRKDFNKLYGVMLIVVSFILVYAIIYLGNAESRLRYPMYILGILMAMNYKTKPSKIESYKTVLISMVIFFAINLIYT